MKRSQISIDTLLRRASAGREPDRKSMFRPSMAYQVLNDPWGVWCEYHAPEKEAVDETTRYEKLRMQWGNEHETAWVAKNHPDAVKIQARRGIEALRETVRAMLNGAPAIHGPQLWDLKAGVYGIGDVIVRDDSASSDLGRYHYRVQEVKRSARVKDYHVVQAILYNRMVERIQGYRPKSVEIILRDGVEDMVVADGESDCDAVLAEWKRLRDGKETPLAPGYNEAGSPWRVYTNKLLEKRKDLTLRPYVSAASRRKLGAKLGVENADALDRLKENNFVETLGPKEGLKIWFKHTAWRNGKPVLLPGETLEIPRRKRSIYFDFETSGDDKPGMTPHVYMIGAYEPQGDAFRIFIAKGAAEEEKIFVDFMDYVGDPRRSHLYHWTNYEIGQMRHVIERYPALSARLTRLMAACVDLKACVADAYLFGTRTYSIKEVAPFLGFHWRQADVDAMESMVLYWEWLDGAAAPATIDKVSVYNEDDCRAMAHVDESLSRQVVS